MYVGFFIFYFIGQDGIGRTEESARKTERNARMLPNLIFFSYYYYYYYYCQWFLMVSFRIMVSCCDVFFLFGHIHKIPFVMGVAPFFFCLFGTCQRAMRETVGLVFAHYYMLGHDTGRQRAQLFFFSGPRARARVSPPVPARRIVTSSASGRYERASARLSK